MHRLRPALYEVRPGESQCKTTAKTHRTTIDAGPGSVKECGTVRGLFTAPLPIRAVFLLPILRSFACALVLLVSIGVAASADQRDERISALKAKISARLPKSEPNLESAKVEGTTSAIANTGLTVLALEGNAPKAERYFRNALRFQDMDTASPNYGNVPFRVGHPEAVDQNAIEFTMWSLGAAISCFGDRLTTEFRQDLVRHFEAGIAAVRRHQVPINYTNIWLLKAANLITLGASTGNAAALEEGRSELKQWLEFTRLNGITEYDSPTYSATQLAALLSIYRDAPDEQTRGSAKLALDYLWTDLAANYFSGSQNLSGPFSRTHDFAFQHEPMSYFYFVEGFGTNMLGPDELGGLWLTIAHTDYDPGPVIRRVADLPVRTIRQSFGLSVGKQRYNYITPSFAIGSASSFYSRQDLQLCVELASTKQLPTISVITENTDAPFGDHASRSAHKVDHLQNAIAAVQNEGLVLALLDLSPGLAQKDDRTVATDIVFPTEADAVILNGNPIDTKSAFKVAAGERSTLFVREGRTVVGLRIFGVEGCRGERPAVELKYDGNDQHAGRLAIYHYRGEPKRITGRSVRVGIVLAAATCETDAEFGDFSRQFGRYRVSESMRGDVWSATLDSSPHRVETALDLKKKECLWRRVDGADVPRALLTINNRDIAAELWNLRTTE